MRAVVVNRFGGPDVLELVDMDTPVPASGQVLIRVAAAALNYSDVLQREGSYLGGPRPPYVAGIEAAGVVEAVGPDTPGPKPGSRVMCIADRGAHATHCLAPVAATCALPDRMSWDDGAAFPVSFVTAYLALSHVARASRGETALIHAAAGGLGSAAVQVALALELRVIATASCPANRDRVRALGADQVVGYDEVTALGKVDVVLQTVGGRVVRDSLRALAPFGRMILLGMSGEGPAPIDPVGLLFRSHTVSGFHLRAALDQPALIARAMEQLLAWVGARKIRPQIGQTFQLAEAGAAHRLIERRDHYGKIVMHP